MERRDKGEAMVKTFRSFSEGWFRGFRAWVILTDSLITGVLEFRKGVEQHVK